jgi:predicted DNA-binding protein YlxM (UPF0122 family)
MNEKDPKDEFGTTYFRYCRDHQGNLVPVDLARQNGRLVPMFPPTITEPYLLADDEETPDYIELLEEVCQCLNEKERRRWLLAIRDARNITEIAQAEAVSRPAIIDCFHRMAKKNPYVRIWLDYKKRRNQHE